MKIQVKLYASLSDYLPSGAVNNEITVKVSETATPAQVMLSLGVPEAMCHMVLINGVYVQPEARAHTTLEDRDHLAIWPPVAGGSTQELA